MATLKQYAQQLRDRQESIANKFGASLERSGKGERGVNAALLVLVAAVIKTLVDKGVITEAELLDALNVARDDSYDEEPMQWRSQ